jgi:RNA polymerase sigma-70 factor (ECF subfamily)
MNLEDGRPASTVGTLAENDRVRGFCTTHWSDVVAAGHGDLAAATAAWERLCRTYWFPIYSFIRRRGFGPHEAEDLTQTFFATLLEKDSLKRVSRPKGKFRTFLLTALTNFLNNEWDKARTEKRGGGKETVSLDETIAEGVYRHEIIEAATPEEVFDRRCAVELVNQVLARLKSEYQAGGKDLLFTKLEPALTGEIPAGMFVHWGADLGMSEGAVKVALHRLRRRFGEVLRHEIAHTVSSPEEIDDEIRYLFAAISR